MKQATPQFLSRTVEKKQTEQTDTVFDPDYLDIMVGKILKLQPQGRFSFLWKKPVENLPEDDEGVRDNVVKDWNHIHETVICLGVPELADIVGGQIFAGGHTRTTSTTNLTYRLADNLVNMTDTELKHLIVAIARWPGDAGTSESLMKVYSSVDGEAARRCVNWTHQERLRYGLICASYAFRPTQSHLCLSVLHESSHCAEELSLTEALHYLFIVSYRAMDKERILETLGHSTSLTALETRITKDFYKINEVEAAVAYSALTLLSSEGANLLKDKIQSVYGFRL